MAGYGNLAKISKVYTMFEEWTALLQSGAKTMELKVQRHYNCDRHTTVALAQSHTRHIWGEAWIEDVIEIPFGDLFSQQYAMFAEGVIVSPV